MSIPESAVGGAASANKLPRFNSSGKLAESMGGGINELASLGGDGRMPVGQAPAKSVYSTGGALALIASDIGAEASANKNVANGYAGIGAGSRIADAQAPLKALYSTAGAQALVPSNIGAQPVDGTLTALAALVIAADSLSIGSGADAFSQVSFAANTFPAKSSAGGLVAKTITDAGLALIDDASAGAQRTTLGVGTGDSPTFAGVTVTGDFIVQGARVVLGGEKTALADNYLDLNANYTADAAQSCGVVASYDPTTSTNNIAGAGAFVAGVAATSNPTVELTAAANVAAGDIIRVQGSTSNDGFYEVHAILAGPVRAQIKGIGVNAAVEDWSGNQFIAEAGVGTITKVNVAILRASTAGSWETAKGSTVPLAYSALPSLGAGLSGDITVVDAGSVAAAGALGKYADAAHEHAVTTGAAGALDTASVSAEGAGAALARAAHTHAIASAAPGAAGVATASGIGASASFARADHTHQSNTAASNIGTANTIGVSGEPARADHVHNHPSIAGDLHPEYIRAGGGRDFTGSQKFTGQKLSVRTLAASGNIVATDDVVRLDGAGAAVDGTLPSATGSGARYMVNTISVANATRVVPQAGDAIDGAANGVAKSLLAAFEGYTFVDVAANKWNSF